MVYLFLPGTYHQLILPAYDHLGTLIGTSPESFSSQERRAMCLTSCGFEVCRAPHFP